MSPSRWPLPHVRSRPVVLIAEDEFLIRAAAAEALRDADLEVVECQSADEALSYLTSGAPVDLVFTDIAMPGSVDGLYLAREVQARYAHIQVVITSAHVAKLNAFGPSALFVPKPYDMDRLAIKLADMVKVQNGGQLDGDGADC